MDQKINPTASSARESARHGDGKFGEQAHSNPGQLSGLTGTRYADMEPHDIDRCGGAGSTVHGGGSRRGF